MRNAARILAAVSLTVAAAIVPFRAAAAEADDTTPAADVAPASENGVAAVGTAGPYDNWSQCEYWRDYYSVFYNTTPCYRGEIAFWYFDYCCI